MNRIRRILAYRPSLGLVLAVGLTLAGAALGPFVHVYSGANAGIVLGPSACSVGLEVHGDPGLFHSCTGADPDAPTTATITTAYQQGRADALAGKPGCALPVVY